MSEHPYAFAIVCAMVGFFFGYCIRGLIAAAHDDYRAEQDCKRNQHLRDMAERVADFDPAKETRI